MVPVIQYGSSITPYGTVNLKQTPKDLDFLIPAGEVLTDLQKNILRCWAYPERIERLDIHEVPRILFHMFRPHIALNRMGDAHGVELYRATPFLQLYLKFTHLQVRPQTIPLWIKHAKGLIKLQEEGYNLAPDSFRDLLYKELMSFWAERENKQPIKRKSMTCTNEEFFTDNVKREFNHDFLHEKFAFTGRPMYESVKPDLSKAYISENMFNQLPVPNKFHLCAEEVFVVAYERYRHIVDESLLVATRNLVTTMTKGWYPHNVLMYLSEILRAQGVWEEISKSLDDLRVKQVE